MPKIGYLGPRGTFTQEALKANLPVEPESLLPFTTVPDVLNAVQADLIDRGFVPIENSTEGSVNITLDTLTFETELLIEAEVVHPIKHYLSARPGVGEHEIECIVSHPHATAQCRKFLEVRFPDIPVVAANSTAEAALEVSRSSEPLAAIATEIAAELYELDVLERDIQDYPGNLTRFVMVGKEPKSRTGADKTSMVCFIRENRPGSLLEILKEFADRRINLTRLESRPTKKVLGEYYFVVDVEGHIEDDEVAGAVGTLKGILRELKLLGSYPAARRGV